MEKIPHQAVILFKANVMERLPDGKVTGISVQRYNKLFTIKGNSEEEVKELTENFIKEVSSLWLKKYSTKLQS